MCRWFMKSSSLMDLEILLSSFLFLRQPNLSSDLCLLQYGRGCSTSLLSRSPDSRLEQTKEWREGTISSFQALASLVWRSITRAHHMPPDAQTTFQLAIQNRSRLQPPLSPYYFGRSIYVTKAVESVREILDHDLGWSAWLVNRAIAAHDDS